MAITRQHQFSIAVLNLIRACRQDYNRQFEYSHSLSLAGKIDGETATAGPPEPTAPSPSWMPKTRRSGMSLKGVIRLAPQIISQQSVGMTSDEATAKITKVVEHAPEWLRQDLTSKDPAVRGRAEETLAAMIAAALKA